MSSTRFFASIVLLAPAACAHVGAPGDPAPEPAAQAEAEALTPILSSALDSTSAWIGVDPGSATLTFSSGWGEETLVPDPVAEAVHGVAADRGLPLDEAPPPCACLDPIAGPTLSPRDVERGECGWVQELLGDEARVSFYVEELDRERGAATVDVFWRIFTPGYGASWPCSYARNWRVELRQVEGGWEAVDGACGVWMMSVPSAADPGDPVWNARYGDIIRAIRDSQSGCSGMIVRRTRGGGLP